jgi:enoyl-CoA hydratase/carnithine racemase
MPEPQRVTVNIEDGVADVRLNRPEKRNAVDQAMFNALVEATERLAAEHSVRAVVLSGEGKSFCAGLDVSSFEAMASRTPQLGSEIPAPPPGRRTNHGQQAAYGWTELPVPVIAAVHGHAVGAGLQIALACDIRIVAPDAQLSVLEIRWGLVPDMTGTFMLPRLVSLDVAKELTWTGRMVSGTEAVELGLATRVSGDPRATALELARSIATKNPHAIRAGKRLLNESGFVDEAQQYRDEAREMRALIGSPNQVEAVRAELEGRAPAFVDPD